jgi:hypothetical protein
MGVSKTHVDPTSLKMTVQRVSVYKLDVAKALATAITFAGETWRDIARESLSVTDHSLKDLAKLDHPYAVRHGALTLHSGSRPMFMQDGKQLVHSQSGTLVSALRGAFVPGLPAGPTYRVWLDRSVPVVRYVLEGTRYMLPRDPLGTTALSTGTQREIRLATVAKMTAKFQGASNTQFG